MKKARRRFVGGPALFKRHFLRDVALDERGRDRGKAQPLLHHRRRDEEARGDLRARDDVVDVREGACAREVVDARRVASVPVTKS